jgi:hypothetical protein
MDNARWGSFLDTVDNSSGVRREMLFAVKTHIRSLYPDFTIVKPCNFPAYLKHPLEGDGVKLDTVYLMTNDLDTIQEGVEITMSLPTSKEIRHTLFIPKHIIKQKQSARIKTPPDNALILIDARHHIRKDTISKALRRVKRLESILSLYHQPPLERSNSSRSESGTRSCFGSIVENSELDKCDSRVKLYFCGICWDHEAVVTIQELLEHKHWRHYIGIVQPNPKLVGVYDVANTFACTSVPVIRITEFRNRLKQAFHTMCSCLSRRKKTRRHSIEDEIGY